MSAYTLIEGGRDELERRFQGLLEAPQRFDQDELEGLVDRFRDRLSLEDILALSARRLRDRPASAERNALLAIVEGHYDEAGRLLGVLARRNALELRVITGSP
jgi:hypothetical protein